MRPCQLCDSNPPMSVWISALLICAVFLLWRQWPKIGWGARGALVAVCMAILGGGVAATYWRGELVSTTGGTCGRCVTPAVSASAPSVESRPALGTRPSPPDSAATRATSATSSGVIAYYFHRTARCHSCLQIEEWAKQAVESGFASEMASGLVEWRAVNVEEAGNEHFVKDFDLAAQSLVLVRVSEGRPAEWKNLKLVWDYLGDHAQFTKYVQEETSTFLGATVETLR